MNDGASWLSILGIGEDGVAGLTAEARALLAGATLVVGGRRHLALADSLIAGERMAWPNPIAAALPDILARRPAPVVVLASGDPFCFGVGPMLAEAAPDFVCLPAPSSLSLACSRLGWALQDVAVISFCGRPITPLTRLLHPGARVLALSADSGTPAEVAAFLAARGFGPSRVTVLEALGGPRERRRASTAEAFALTGIHALNILAIEVEAGPDARAIPLGAGLDDDLFAHDGQITKREIRAVTLAALAPRRGELLWDIGAGSGAVAIEWLLQHPANRAIGMDRHAERLARAAGNADRMGVPSLRLVRGEALACLDALPSPNAVFIGGGARDPDVIHASWKALQPFGRLVVNSVTTETETVLMASQRVLGGSLTRIGVERLDRIGELHGFRPAMTVTQWAVTKGAPA